MSNEDPYRPNQGRDRGAYTPPTDDDLPFDRQSYDPRRNGGGGGGNRGGGGRSGPPITLIISVLVLLALAIGVFFMYFQGGLRASEDAPAAVGTPVGPMTAEAPIDAQPVDPEAGIDVYAGEAAQPATDPTFAPPPEEVGPRPAPQPIETPTPLPPVIKRPTTPAPAPTPAPTTPPKTEQPSAVPAGGSSAVQIGAFSTPSLAEREYNAVVGRYPRLVRGANRRVQEVTTASGATVYRTTVTNLSREQATGLCAAIRDGGGDCLVR